MDIVHIRTQSHDYIRHDTVTLFTALDYLEGRLLSSIERQYRHQEWLDFLKKNAKLLSVAADRRQLRHAQTPESKSLARKVQELPYTFQSDLKFADEHGRALLSRHHGVPTRRQFQLGSRVRKLNHHISGTAKCPADSLCLERQIRRKLEQNTTSLCSDNHTCIRKVNFEMEY